MAKNDFIERMRDLLGKMNRNFSQNEPENSGFYQAAPKKTEEPEFQDPPPQITGTRRRRTNDIPGNKAGDDRISGGYEAGGKSPVA